MRNRSVTYVPELTFQALADPTRLAVLELLRSGPQAAGQIAGAFSISRPAISKHLRQLQKARLVAPSRSGRHRFYRLTVEPLKAVDAWLNRYRMFWTNNLDHLKSFVEQEHTREMAKVAGKDRKRHSAKTNGNHRRKT
jgi:DNA-binding transcriptional ArsR family regulator